MPSKTLAKAGLVAVMVAILLPWTFNRWVKSRSFEPVNMLVSLEAGKVQVVEFAINIRESYSVRMEMDYSEDDWNEGKCPFRSWKDTDWKVYRLSGGAAKKRDLQASSAEMLKQGDIPDGFHGWPGKYQLEWTIPRASACLNARHPQLHVYASSSDYQEAGGFLLFACVFLGGTGIVLILRALGAWVHGYLFGKRPLRMFPGVILRNVIPLQRHRPMALIKDPPNFGLVYGCILWILIIIFMIVRPLPPKGLLVDFKEARAVGVEKSPWTETMAVYVNAKQEFLVSGKAVAREDLRSKLQEELLRRGVWVVYFEADGNCLYMNAIYAMDTIQGSGAKVIWITPKMREEWKQKSTTR